MSMVSALTDPDPALLDAPIVVERLQTDPEHGLTAEEAARRLVVVGPNDIETVPPVPAWQKLVAQFRSPLIYLLFAALVASVAVWVVEGATGWPVDAVVIGAILVLNAVLGYMQEARAERAVDALSRMTAAMATVVRDGVERNVPASELVPGDVLLLAEGDAVAADARLLSTTGLEVSEAALTGQSEAVLKDARAVVEPAALGDTARHGIQGHRGHQGGRAGGGDRHGDGDADGSNRRPGAYRRQRHDTVAARGCPGQPDAGHRRAGDRRGSDRDHFLRLRHPQRRGRGDGRAVGRLAGRGRRAGGTARHHVARTRFRDAADGRTKRNRQRTLFSGDPGVSLGGLLGQDRHPHHRGDDHRAGGHTGG